MFGGSDAVEVGRRRNLLQHRDSRLMGRLARVVANQRHADQVLDLIEWRNVSGRARAQHDQVRRGTVVDHLDVPLLHREDGRGELRVILDALYRLVLRKEWGLDRVESSLLCELLKAPA